MTTSKWTLLLCVLITSVLSEDYQQEIETVLNHLNAIPYSICKYNYEKLLSAQKKADVIELNLDVNVDCIRTYPPVTFNCVAFVQNQQPSRVLREATCTPRPNAEETVSKAENLGVSKEANFDESGEHFVAMRRESAPCTGCLTDLQLNVPAIEELTDLALKHIESERNTKHALVKVVRLQQQIVSGVKYILLAQFASDATTQTCQVTYLQKPWISKAKHIIQNNCTKSQEFALQANDIGNEINANLRKTHKSNKNSNNFDAMAEKGVIIDDAMITPARLEDLEAQIASTDNFDVVPTVVRYADEIYMDPTEENRSKRSADSDESNSSSEEKRQKRAVRQFEKISPDEKELVEYLAFFAAESLDQIDDDNRKRVVLQILGAKKLQTLDDGIFFHLILRMGISRCPEDKKAPNSDCRNAVLENFTKICKVQVNVNNEYFNPKLVKSQCQNMKRGDRVDNHTNGTRYRRNSVPGAPGELNDDDRIKELLAVALNHLDSKSEKDNKYKVVQVTKATSQVVSGALYEIHTQIALSSCLKNDNKNAQDCDLLSGEQAKECTIKVWEQLWKNRREYTIKCDEKPEEYKFEQKLTRNKRALIDADLEHFFIFREKYEKSYATLKEERYRFKVFKSNLKRIDEFNKNEQGTARYAVTKFADLTAEEFSRMHGLRMDLRNENELPMPMGKISPPGPPLPTEFDWRTKGVVSKVKDQGQCGSCWAFSVTGNVEGQYAIKHGELLEFSEQELVDCDTEDQGCNGGLMDTAYREIEKMGGLETEQDYPYESEDEKCHFKKNLVKAQLSGAVNISQDETEMAQWLVQNGPISIAINANAMQFYVGGVSHPFKFLCSPKSLDHGVLIVGYGMHEYPKFKKKLPYWIVKNSWGPSWGEQGYYRVYRGDGTCGVNQTPSSAVVI